MPTYLYWFADPTTSGSTAVVLDATDIGAGAQAAAQQRAGAQNAQGTSTWSVWGVDYAAMTYADCTVTTTRAVSLMPRPIPPPTPR
jgi:hypothetical protein